MVLPYGISNGSMLSLVWLDTPIATRCIMIHVFMVFRAELLPITVEVKPQNKY